VNSGGGSSGGGGSSSSRDKPVVNVTDESEIIANESVSGSEGSVMMSIDELNELEKEKDEAEDINWFLAIITGAAVGGGAGWIVAVVIVALIGLGFWFVRKKKVAGEKGKGKTGKKKGKKK